MAPAPGVRPGTLSFYKGKYPDIDFEATDIAGQIGVQGAAQVDGGRSIWNDSNWIIVAQCEVMVDNELKVGVVKEEERTYIPGIDVANNNYKFLLDCPTP
jgi:hypothetical protein